MKFFGWCITALGGVSLLIELCLSDITTSNNLVWFGVPALIIGILISWRWK